MNMAGRLKRLGSAIQVAPRRRGAGRRPGHAGDRRAGSELRCADGADHARLQGQRPRGAGRTRRCSRRWPRSRPAGSPTGPAPPTALPEFEALRDQGRDIKNHTPRPSRPLPRGVRGQGRRAGRHGALGARRRRGARDRARALPGGGRPHGHQEQEHGHRGDRPHRLPRVARARARRDRSRRVHPADLRPAAEPYRRPGRAHDQGRDQRPVRAAPWRPRGSRRRPTWWPRRAGSCASAISPPMSASPAPTS